MNSIKVCFQFNSPAAGCYEAKMNPNLHHIHMMGEHIRYGSGLCSLGGRPNAFENMYPRGRDGIARVKNKSAWHYGHVISSCTADQDNFINLSLPVEISTCSLGLLMR